MTQREQAGRTWAFRAAVEVEVQGVFHALAANSRGAPQALRALTERAAQDEGRHRVECAELAESLGVLVPELPVARAGLLGPPTLSTDRRALFTAVALGCITESISAALLGEMLEHAQGLARNVVHGVLRDEVDHARIGWGWLAWQAQNSDVSWLGAHVPAMIAAALPREQVDSGVDLREFGILSGDRARTIPQEVIQDVLRPGFAQFNILF